MNQSPIAADFQFAMVTNRDYGSFPFRLDIAHTLPVDRPVWAL
jgi:hypothetical protein